MQLHGSGMAVGPQGAIEEPRIDRSNGGGIQPQFFHRARAQDLYQHVGIGEKTFQPLDAVRIFQIERDAALVAVHRVKRGGGITPERWPPAAGVVTPFGALDLDDVRTQGGEDLAGVRAGQVLRDLGHFDASQRQATLLILSTAYDSFSFLKLSNSLGGRLNGTRARRWHAAA